MFRKKRDNQYLKRLIASVLLVIFFWANYGINFAGHHHGEEPNRVEHLSNNYSECSICYFQYLLYDPLPIKEFEFYQNAIIEEAKISSYYEVFYSHRLTSFISLRGPPSLSI